MSARSCDRGRPATSGTALPVASVEGRSRGARHGARGSRGYDEIVWSSTFTLLNLILGGLLVLTLTLADTRDALFGGVIVANTLIGIVQEVRAKRVLDRLAHWWRRGRHRRSRSHPPLPVGGRRRLPTSP